MFSPNNLPWLAYSICNLCLYFFCNCKITNKVFESFVKISWEKNMRSDQVKVPFWFKSHFFLFSLKPDRCNSSIFRKRPTISLIWPHLVLFLKKKAFGNILFFILTINYRPYWFFVVWHVQVSFQTIKLSHNSGNLIGCRIRFQRVCMILLCSWNKFDFYWVIDLFNYSSDNWKPKQVPVFIPNFPASYLMIFLKLMIEKTLPYSDKVHNYSSISNQMKLPYL